MATKLLILGKGDNIITMILDNLYSHNTRTPDIHIYNNLNLPILNTFEHDRFNIEVFDTLNIDDYDLMALGVYQPSHKRKIMSVLNPDPNKFMNIIHEGLEMSHMSKLGCGLLINSKVSIAAHTTIGDFVSINRHVSIGEGTTIGMGTNILHTVKIGRNCVIGAGSVVTKDIPDNVVAYGSPCKVIREN